MLCEHSHMKSESLAQIHTTIAEIQSFSEGLFFIGTPCKSMITGKHIWEDDKVGENEKGTKQNN